MKRPDSFEFTMGFVGDPEAGEVRAYVEKLEAELERAYEKYDNMVLLQEIGEQAEIIENHREARRALEQERAALRAALAAKDATLGEMTALARKAERERDRLQLMLDSRPAINTGLLEAYIEWTQGVYLADMGKAVGHN